MAGAAGPDPLVQAITPADTSQPDAAVADELKKRQLKDALYTIFMTAAHRGSKWIAAQHPGDVTARKDMILAPWKEMETKELSAKRAAWNAWSAWCRDQVPVVDTYESGVLDVSR